ncbi:MAG: amidohydrolase family protein [Gemmatimonadetes bacterium]|nr:amidohydrolase family protein [Gemmatimonadota bacterium]
MTGCTAPSPTADLLLRGGTVWTGAADAGRAEALAILDGRILAVGSAAELAPLVGPTTEVLELEGRTVLPGFIDAHVHFITGGFQLASVDLRGARSPEEFSRRIAAFAATVEPGTWITGGSWDHEAWGGMLPDRSWIDSVTPEHPVFVSRLDLHMAVANTRALERAGVEADAVDPPGGTLVRDVEGRLTGVFKDEAMALIDRAIPAPTDAQLDRALAAAAQHALSLGVTQVHDMGTWAHFDTYRRAHQAGRLPLRVYAVVPMSTGPRLADLVSQEGRGDPRLWWGGLKAFVDGSLGSTTAWFHEPYTDEPGTSGLVVTDPTELRARILEADAAGLQTIVHAIGDRANDWLLDVFAEAAARDPARERRPRIEHAQHLTAEAIARFGAQGVIPSMQPYHAADDGRWAEKRIGAERIRTTYAFRSLAEAGAALAFGSDWTVAPLDPLLGIQAAVTRQTLDGAHPEGWVPEQRIDLETTLRAYTSGAAHAGYRDAETGSLEPGKAADLVVLSGDLFGTPPERIAETLDVDLTLVEGTAAYRRR